MSEMSEARKRAYRKKRITEAVILLIGFLIVAAVITIAATAAEPEETVAETEKSAEETTTVPETVPETTETETETETAESSVDIVDNYEEDTGDGCTDIDITAGEGGQTADQPPELLIKRTGYAVSVCGVECEYADYLHYCMALFGRQDFYPYALAQMFQESGFDPAAVGADGHDLGLFQFRDKYWEEYASEAGYPGASIWDPYKQIEIYAYHVDKRIRASADLYTTISDHYTGGAGYAPDYVSAVLQWVKYEE